MNDRRLSFTLLEQCASINIGDVDDFTYIADLHTELQEEEPAISAKLFISHNCTTAVEYDVELEDISVIDATPYIVINPSFLSKEGTSLEDGVYSITITIKLADNSIYTEKICIASLCEVRCDLVTKLAADIPSFLSSNINAMIIALENIQYCDTCACEAGCTIYSELKNLLKMKKDGKCSNC